MNFTISLVASALLVWGTILLWEKTALFNFDRQKYREQIQSEILENSEDFCRQWLKDVGATKFRQMIYCTEHPCP